MASIFSRIILGEIPCHKISENETCISFLDINPLTKGHTLVVPKLEIDYLFDLDDKLFSDLWLHARLISDALLKATSCKRVGAAVVGFEVPHAHIHLVPMFEMSDINFSNERLMFSFDELSNISNSIRSFLK